MSRCSLYQPCCTRIHVASLLFLLISLAALVAAAARRPTSPATAPTSARLAGVQRQTQAWSWAGLGAGVVLGGLALTTSTLGRGVLIAAPLLALGVLTGVSVGQLRAQAPDGPVRTAGLTPRRLLDHLPKQLTMAVVPATGLLPVVLAFTTAVGGPDDLGRSGRALFRQCGAASAERHTPWPGSFYSLQLSAVVVTGLVIAAYALHRVARRPDQGEDSLVEDSLRAAAARSVTAAFGLLVSLTLAGVLLLTANGLLGITCHPAWWTVLGTGSLLLAPLLFALASWCVTCLIVPPRQTAPSTHPR